MQRNPVLLGELHRSDLQHLGAEARHLEHLLEGDAVELARRGHQVRVGGVDAVDVRVDLADVGFERRRDGDRGGVRAAAAERRDVALVVDALEAGDHRDGAGVEHRVDARAVDALDARARVRRVGAHAHLRAGEGARLVTELVDRHREQRDGLLLAGRDQRVVLARIGIARRRRRSRARPARRSRPTSPTPRRRRGCPAARSRPRASRRAGSARRWRRWCRRTSGRSRPRRSLPPTSSSRARSARARASRSGPRATTSISRCVSGSAAPRAMRTSMRSSGSALRKAIGPLDRHHPARIEEVQEARGLQLAPRSRGGRSPRGRAAGRRGTRWRSRRSGSRPIPRRRRGLPPVPSPTPSCPRRADPRARSRAPTARVSGTASIATPRRRAASRVSRLLRERKRKRAPLRDAARRAQRLARLGELGRHLARQQARATAARRHADRPRSRAATRRASPPRRRADPARAVRRTIPVSTSPVPPLPSAGPPVGFSATRPSGAAITVAAPFRITTRAGLRRDAPRRADAVAVDLRRRDTEQPRRFSRVRRQDRGGPARLQRGERSPCEREEPVGVEHQRARAAHGEVARELLHLGVATDAGTEARSRRVRARARAAARARPPRNRRRRCRRRAPSSSRCTSLRGSRCSSPGHAIVTSPAPLRAAPSAASAAAPVLPRDPATTSA